MGGGTKAHSAENTPSNPLCFTTSESKAYAVDEVRDWKKREKTPAGDAHYQRDLREAATPQLDTAGQSVHYV